jgi:signal transduction histidine kinase
MNKIVATIGKQQDETSIAPLRQLDEDLIHASKAEFIRQASHDIQGSFFGVSSLCTLIKNENAGQNPENIGILAAHLTEACQTYKHKLGNFLEFARLEAGLKDVILEPLNIAELLKRIIAENGSIASGKKIKIELTLSEPAPQELQSDEFRISQICNNLITNAIHFSPEGGRVTVRLACADERCFEILVEDQGEGMTEQQLNNLFTVSSLERKCLRNPGGLGLLVTRYLVEDVLGGNISLSSQPGSGTTCSVIIPMHSKNQGPGNNLYDRLHQ